MSFVLGATLLAVVTSVACALPGCFVVLRRNSMLVDAISHAVLPGIVVGYLLTRDLGSPLLIVGAALSGLVVVLGSEWLSRTGLLAGDAPQGLIFPALFSVGVILLTMNAANIHLDVHVVLVGDLNLAAVGQLTVGDTPIGPSYLYVMLAVLALNILVLTLLYPVLTLTTFDPRHAAALGIRTGMVSTVFMVMVAVTVTAAFHAAGVILVIALMVVPPATAHLLTRRLGPMIALTAVLAVASALAGFRIAYRLDAPTSAGMAVFSGLVVTVALLGTRVARHHRRRTRPVPRSGPGQDPDGVGGRGAEGQRVRAAVDQHLERAGER